MTVRCALLWAFGVATAALLIGCAGGTGGTSSPSSTTPAVSVSPSTATARPGDAPLQFAATVTGTSNTAVSWSVNGVAGGNASLGTITSSGQYTPPASVPASPGNVVSVQAALVMTPTLQAASAVTLDNPIPIVSSVSPATIGVGAFTIQVTGSAFVSGAQVMFGSIPLTTTFVSPTQLTATGTATTAQAGSVTVTVMNPAPGTNG